MIRSGGGLRWAPVVLLVVGLVLLAIGGYQVWATREFVRTAESVPGRVIRNESRSRGAGRSPSYYPVFEFRDRSGTRHEKVSNTGSSPASYRTGEKVTVLYSPHNPGDARIKGVLGLWVLPGILLVLGIGVSVAAVIQSRSGAASKASPNISPAGP